MTITIRLADTDEDYAAWRKVRLAVVPNERADSVEDLRAQAGPQQRCLLAELDGELAGSGVVGQSDLAGSGALAARVLPGYRRRGLGTAILRELAGRAAGMGFEVVGSNVEDPGSVSFAERYGFREVDRQVEQVRVLGRESAPRVPDGVEIVRVSARPELWPAVYETVGAQAFQDMALISPLVVSLEQWERQWITDPDAMFVALNLAGGEVIGCAGLLPDTDDPGRAEHALTAVRRDAAAWPPRSSAAPWPGRRTTGCARSTPGLSAATTTCAR